MKVFLIDHRLDGHHQIYINALDKIEYTVKCVDIVYFKPIRHFFAYFIKRYHYLNQIKKMLIDNQNDKNSLYHFLYMDDFLIPIWNLFKDFKTKIIVTLHQIPSSKVKILILKKTSRHINKIIVHSEYIQKKLFQLGIHNVVVVDYPRFHKYEKNLESFDARKYLNLPTNKMIISALGSTRYDKGIDILLNSFVYLNDHIKKEIIILLSGEEDYFKENVLKLLIDKYSINCIYKFEKISDDEFYKSIISSDMIVIPYRKVFKGISGLMIEAISNRIPCISSDNESLKSTLQKHSAGLIFESENEIDLANKIRDAFYQKDTLKNKLVYNGEYEVEYFIESYDKLYKKFISGE